MHRDRHATGNGTSRAWTAGRLASRRRLDRIARHRGYSITALIEEWAEKAEARIVRNMTSKQQREYYADVIT